MHDILESSCTEFYSFIFFNNKQGQLGLYNIIQYKINNNNQLNYKMEQIKSQK